MVAHFPKQWIYLSVWILLLNFSYSFVVPRAAVTTSTAVLFGKKANRKGTSKKQPVQEKQSVKDARFDAQTRQFMFSIVGLTKVLPDKSKTILKNIHLAFYPGAKIGIVGSNGSGMSCAVERCDENDGLSFSLLSCHMYSGRKKYAFEDHGWGRQRIRWNCTSTSGGIDRLPSART